MTAEHDLLMNMYNAFNARDVDAVLVGMHTDVDWTDGPDRSRKGNEKRIIFDPFCLDLANECLWKGPQAIKLRPKAFAVLDYLVGRPAQLVTQEELCNAVWPAT